MHGDSTSEELFFGKKSEYVFEKTDKGEYMQVAVKINILHIVLIY